MSFDITVVPATALQLSVQPNVTQIIKVVPRGTQGERGLPGPSGVDLHYVHEQVTPAATWNVTHGLNKYPSVVVLDSTGSVVVGTVNYVDENNVSISFSGGFAGRAIFN